jgi:hypothetical protein
MSSESLVSPPEEFSKPLPVFVKLAVMLRNLPWLRLIFAKVAALLRGNRRRGEPRISEPSGESEPSREAPVTSSTLDQDAAVLQPSSIRAIVEPETLVEPEAIVEPETIAEPEAIVEPETTVEPQAIVEPETIVEPQAIVEPETTAEPETIVEPETTVEPETIVEPETTVEPQAIAEPETIVEPQAIAEPETEEQPAREKLIRRRWTETGIKMWNPDVHGAGHAALNIQGSVELLPPEPGQTLPRYDKLEFKLVRSCVDGQAVEQIVCEGVVVDPPKRRARHWTA